MSKERKPALDLLSLPQNIQELIPELRRLSNSLEWLIAFLQSPQYAELLETWQDSNKLLGGILRVPVTYAKDGKKEN